MATVEEMDVGVLDCWCGSLVALPVRGQEQPDGGVRWDPPLEENCPARRGRRSSCAQGIQGELYLTSWSGGEPFSRRGDRFSSNGCKHEG